MTRFLLTQSITTLPRFQAMFLVRIRVDPKQMLGIIRIVSLLDLFNEGYTSLYRNVK